jgi:Fe-S cluster biogenesis protein NfuA
MIEEVVMTGKVGYIEIVCEPTMAPEVCIFRVDRTIHESGAVRCTSAELAVGSPLLENLFAVAGVLEVLVSGDSLTIAKDATEEWSVIGSRIGEAIRAAFATGEPLISSASAAAPSSEQEIRRQIQALFDTEINPAISAHGGQVAIAAVKDTAVHLVMSGGCQGCASAQATLRLGIEQRIREKIPEVTEIVDVTDHAGGEDPYYP